MNNFILTTPVVFLIYKRPETTARVFEVIRKVKPLKLFVVADGPKPEKVGEAEKCIAARKVIDGVDWECEVITNYSDVNLGCKNRVSTGLDWVFNQVDEAIILEDDCLPDPTFFRFCQELLEYYRDDKRIMAISGDNFQFGRKRTDDSYYFSRYNHCWGWATWKRAWQYYDISMKLWPRIRDSCFLESIIPKNRVASWKKRFQYAYDNKIDTWAYRWTFACWIQSGLTILPNVNLISNIGFGGDGTHTTHTIVKSKLENMTIESMTFPLKHPSFTICDIEDDEFTEKIVFKSQWIDKLYYKITKKIKNNNII